jgi:hypothetical protein
VVATVLVAPAGQFLVEALGVVREGRGQPLPVLQGRVMLAALMPLRFLLAVEVARVKLALIQALQVPVKAATEFHLL